MYLNMTPLCRAPILALALSQQPHCKQYACGMMALPVLLPAFADPTQAVRAARPSSTEVQAGRGQCLRYAGAVQPVRNTVSTAFGSWAVEHKPHAALVLKRLMRSQVHGTPDRRGRCSGRCGGWTGCCGTRKCPGRAWPGCWSRWHCDCPTARHHLSLLWLLWLELWALPGPSVQTTGVGWCCSAAPAQDWKVALVADEQPSLPTAPTMQQAGASASLVAGHRKGRFLEGLPTQEGGTLHPSAMLVLALPLIPACTCRSWSPVQLATHLWLMAGSPCCSILNRPQARRDLMLLRCPGVSTQHPQQGRAAAGGDEQRPGTQQGTLEAATTTPSNICLTLHNEESTAAQQGPAHVPAAGGTGQDLLARNADMLHRDRPYQAGLAAWAGWSWPGSYIHPLEWGRRRGLASRQPPCQLSIPGLCRQQQPVS